MEQPNKPSLYVYSGECNKGRVGDPVGANDEAGWPLHVGDIVQLWEGRYLDTDIECWTPAGGLTAIVNEDFTSFSDGSLRLNGPDRRFFCMGIASCGFNDPAWRIRIVKSHEDVIPGEHWKAYGFNYRHSTIADELLAASAALSL